MLLPMPPVMQRTTIFRMMPRLCALEQKSTVLPMFQFLQTIEPFLNAKCDELHIRNGQIAALPFEVFSYNFL